MYDDWLNPYLDAIYTKYLDQGSEATPRIVTNTIPYIAWESRRWRFENPGRVLLYIGVTLS